MQLDYKGFREMGFTTEEINALYADATLNPCELLTNEYLMIKDEDGNIADYMRWSGTALEEVSRKPIQSKWGGVVKPRNPQQIMAFDMLMNPEITIKAIHGRFGSGKDFIMINAALSLIEHGKYEKIIWVRNNIEVKNTTPLGALPGSAYEKLSPFLMPFADHVGGIEGVEELVRQKKVEVEHLGFIRGRDFKKSIIYCSEAENITTQHCQLLIGRVGEGSALWINGDCKQTDKLVFEENNGLFNAIIKLKGNPLFGFIHLEKSERSKTAALADLLD